MQERDLKTINSNYPKLCELLDVDDDLIFHMISTDCLSPAQIDELKQCQVKRQRTEKLLAMLKRRSIEHFKQFKDCLDKTQRHLLPMFTGDEGIFIPTCSL